MGRMLEICGNNGWSTGYLNELGGLDGRRGEYIAAGGEANAAQLGDPTIGGEVM